MANKNKVNFHEITIKLDYTNTSELEIIEFLEREHKLLTSIGHKDIKVEKLLKRCLAVPTKKSNKAAIDNIINDLSPEARLKAMYDGWLKETEASISQSEFLMNVYKNMPKRDERKYIRAALQ